MSNISLCWPNRTDEATISSFTVSGGLPTTTPATWLTTLPLLNVKDRILQKVARTAAGTKTVAVCALLPKERLLGVVALANHNLSISATVRIRFFKGTSNASALLYDSGATNRCWPVVKRQAQIPWGSTNFWLGTIEEEQRQSYTKLFTHFSPLNKGGRYVEIIIDDTVGNVDNFVQIGRLFVGQWIEPEFNPDWGDVNQGYIDSTEIQEVPGTGTEFFYNHAKKRTVTLAWKHLSLSDAFSGVYDAYRSQGVSGEVLYAFSKNVQDQNYYARTFLARFASLDPIGMPYLNAFSASINLQEIL